MNKLEYLNELRERLQKYPLEFRRDILDSFEEHFSQGLAKGQSEQEIMDNLGTVDEVIENIRMMNGDVENKRFERERREDLNHALKSQFRALSDTFRSAAEDFRYSTEEYFRSDSSFDEETIEPDIFHSDTLKLELSPQNIDVFISGGSVFRYRFYPAKNVFTGEETELDMNCTEETIRFFTTNGFGMFRGSSRLYLEIPEQIQFLEVSTTAGDTSIRHVLLKQAKIHATSGDMNISESAIEALDYTCSSGDASLTDCNISEANLSAASGDITVRHSKGNLRANVASGDIDISYHDGDEIILKAASGDIDVEADCLYFSAETASGDIDFTMQKHLEKAEISSLSGDVDFDTNDFEINALCVSTSGDIENNTDLPSRKEAKKRYVIGERGALVNISTKSGDITIE